MRVFCNIFDFQVNYMLYWRFHFKNEIPINHLFTQWRWTYILDFGPWKWSALNMKFVVKRPSRMQGQYFFRSWMGRAAVSGRVQNSPGRAALPGSDTPESSGVFNVCIRTCREEDHGTSADNHICLMSALT